MQTAKKGRETGFQSLPWRLALTCAAAAVSTVLALGALGLIALWGLLFVTERDLSVGGEGFPLWPGGLAAIDLYYSYAWVYLANGLILLFVALPLTLALLEQAVVTLAARRQHRGRTG